MVKKGVKGKLLKKRFSPVFHRPKTLKKSREPKYPRVSVAPMQKLDQFQVCAQLIPDDFGIARARTMRVPPARYHRNLLGF